VDPEDLSIGLEVWARPGLGLSKLVTRVEHVDPILRERQCDAEWQSFQNVWQRVNELSLLGSAKAYVIYRLAQRAMHLPGDFIECGVYRGGLSLMLGLMAKQAGSEKRVFMCDTFAGLPQPDRGVDKAYVWGSMVCPRGAVEEYVSQLGLRSRCILEAGLFSETLPKLPHDRAYALAHLDCDLYHGTKTALEYIYPRLANGGPVILDDYYDESHGVMHAVNEFAENHQLVVHLSIWGQAFFMKGEHPGTLRTSKIGPHAIYLTTETIREEPLFLRYLEEILELREQNTNRLRRFVKFCREGPSASTRALYDPPPLGNGAPRHSDSGSYAFRRRYWLGSSGVAVRRHSL
jgi:O-methyltransferase